MDTKVSKRITELLAWCGVVGPVVFVLVFTVAGFMRAGYSPIHQTISDLGVGVRGWIVDGASVLLWVLLSAFLVSFFRSIRTVVGDLQRWLCVAVLELPPLGFAVAGIFTEAPSTLAVHWLVGSNLGLLGPVIAFFVTSMTLRRDGRWRGLSTYSLVACFVTLALDVFLFWGFTPGTPLASARLGGIVERVVVIEILCWYVVAGWHLSHRVKLLPLAQQRIRRE